MASVSVGVWEDGMITLTGRVGVKASGAGTAT